MKRIFNKKSSVIGLAMLMSFSVISCSDDDFTPQLEIGGDVEEEGIEAEITGRVATLSITSNDKWTISVPEEASNWVYVPVKEGQGNREVPVSIDANLGSSAGRNTVITIKTGDVVRTVAVTQMPTYNGQAVANSNEAANYIQIADMKGVGLGYNVNSFKPYNNSIINLNALEELQKLNPSKYKSFFTYNIEAAAKAQGAVIDSLEHKQDSLGVSLEIDVNYAAFKLHIGGAYHGDETKDYFKTEYNYGATYNIAGTHVDLPSVTSIYNDATKESSSMNEKEVNWASCLYTPGFIEVKQEVEEALTEEDDEWFNDAMDELTSKYGAAVISGCDLGGNVSLSMKFNRDSIAEVMHVDTAKIKTAIESGLLQVGVGVEVSYKKDAITMLENSCFKYQISGGAKNTQDELSGVLSTQRKKGDEGEVYGTLHEKLDAWIASLNGNDATTLSYTSVQIYPIWNFFKNTKELRARTKVKKWVQNHYKDEWDILNSSYVNADTTLK